MEDFTKKRAKKVVDAGMNIQLAELTEAIVANDKLDALLAKEIEIPSIPDEIEITLEGVEYIKGEKGDASEYPQEISISNLPEIQKVEVLNFPEQKAPIVNYSPQEVNVEMNNDEVVAELKNISEILSQEEVETIEKTEIVDEKGETVNFKKLFDVLSERIANIRVGTGGGWGGGLSTNDSTALQNLGGKFATRIDDVSTSGVTYIGKANVGATNAQAVWQIQKVDETGTPTTAVITWAGSANFNQVWNDRLTLTYL